MPRFIGLYAWSIRKESTQNKLYAPKQYVHYDATPAYLEKLCMEAGYVRKRSDRLLMVNAWVPLGDSPGSETIGFIPTSAQTHDHSELWTVKDDAHIEDREENRLYPV